MKKLKKIMLFAAVLSFLPVSVCNAVNTVTIPTQLVTCERGEIRITSSSAAAVNVDINLDGVARFADDGSVSKSVSVSSNSPQTLEVVSAGSGKTVVSLGEPYVCVSSDCSFEFVDSALRFYKDKDGTAPDSVFYAGKEQQLYVAAVSSTTGGQCTFSRLSGDKITLKAHKPGGADSVLVKYSDQNTVVADKNGKDLILQYSDDGFYQLPGFTYNDAGEFILSASGKMKSQPIIPQMLFRVPAMLSRVIPGLRHPRMLFT